MSTGGLKPCMRPSMCIFTWLSMLVEGWSELAGMSYGAHKVNRSPHYGPTNTGFKPIMIRKYEVLDRVASI